LLQTFRIVSIALLKAIRWSSVGRERGENGPIEACPTKDISNKQSIGGVTANRAMSWLELGFELVLNHV